MSTDRQTSEIDEYGDVSVSRAMCWCDVIN